LARSTAILPVFPDFAGEIHWFDREVLSKTAEDDAASLIFCPLLVYTDH